MTEWRPAHTARSYSDFETEMFSLLDKINETLPDIPSDMAMFALAVALAERITEENDDLRERLACFDVMMNIVLAGVEEEET